jgi:predicted RND superfamily exporter protein
LILLLPWGIWAVLHIPIGSAGVHEWLPEGRPERLRYEQFSARFGSDQIVLISWDGSSLNDQRFDQFASRVLAFPDFETYFTKIEAPDRIIQTLTAHPMRVSETEALRRLQGVFIGRDGTVALLLGITNYGVANHKKTMEVIRKAADDVPELGREKLRLVGTLYEAYAVDEAAEGSLKKLVLPSTILGLLISWICLGRVRSAIVVLAIAGIGQLVAVSMVYYMGHQFSAVLIVLPTLVFMLTLSGAVHLINYFSESNPSTLGHEGSSRGVQAIRLGWKPCLLSSLTTMLGMGSLMTSQLAPVRQFGLYSAIGLGIATVVLLIAFPSIADGLFSLKLPRRKNPQNTVLESSDSPATKPYTWICLSQKMQSRFVQWENRNAVLITAATFLLLGLTFVGLSQLRSSTKFCDMFPENSRTNQDMKWFESKVGPIATVEVLIHFSNQNSIPLFDQARLVHRITQSLRNHDEIGGVLSATTFMPRWSEEGNTRSAAQRGILRQRIEDNFDKLEAQGVAFRDSTETVWRLMSKVSAVSQKSYGQLTDSVKQAVDKIISEEGTTPQSRIEYTGLSPVMHETQIALLSDLGYSFLSAFLLITPVMMWIVRSFWGGLLIMLPNVLPVTLAFGIMGWMGWSLDIAGILTASIALGIAVDDTLHFVSWYMMELDQGYPPLEAIGKTFASCSTAMLHTTLISCGAMFPFLFAEFLPTQQFAKLMIAMLSAAIVGDLVVLPALLLSPLGRVVRSRRFLGSRSGHRSPTDSSVEMASP